MKLATLIAVAGIAAAASAQGTMTFYWELDNGGDIANGGTGTGTLYAAMDPGATGFAGSIYGISGDARWADGTVAFDNLLDALTDDGNNLGGGVITGIESFQLPPLFNGDFVADNPIAIGTVSYTPNSYELGTASFSTENHLNADVYTDDFGSSVPYDIVVEGGTFNIVPAPASMALLGLGGLVAGRRRR